jgi:hypothetical protein
MLKTFLIVCVSLAASVDLAAAQAVVRVDAAHVKGPRTLNEQTRTAAIRDYLQSWQTLSNALAQNRADLLDADFVGTARDRLANTIREQAALGIRTHYRDRAHDIQVVFYSPEGLSIELIDTADYDVELTDGNQAVTTEPAHARYIVVLTPSEVRWRVRVLQADSD